MDCLALPVAVNVSAVADTPAAGSSSSVKLPSQSEAVSKTDDNLETHKCPYKACGKFFSKKYNLKAHLRLHTGEQPFECPRPDCNKKFKWRSSLSSHSVWHTRKDGGIAVTNLTQSDNPAVKPKASFGINPTTNLSTITAREKSGKDSQTFNATSLGKKLEPKRKRPRPVKGSSSRSKLQKTTSVSTPSTVADESNPKSCPAGASIMQPPSKKLKPFGPQSKQDIAMVCPMPVSVPNVVDSIAAAVNAVIDSAGTIGISGTVENQVFNVVPGSPVTSDGDKSEKSLDTELFDGTLLPPLTEVSGRGAGKLGGDLLLEEGDVEAILGDTSELFPCSSPSAGALQGLDTRFGPFELDNLQSFYLGKVEGL